MTDDEIKQVQELYEWHADHLDYRAPALAALLREHAAMKAVVEAAQMIPYDLLAAFLDHEQAKGRWNGGAGSRQVQTDLRAVGAALEALAKEQG